MCACTEALILLVVAGDVVPVDGRRDLVVLGRGPVHQQVPQERGPAGPSQVSCYYGQREEDKSTLLKYLTDAAIA